MKRIWLLCAACFGMLAIVAQPAAPPFRKDINAFLRKDSIQMPPHGTHLFIGSSSFTMWTNIQQAFRGYPILNRGFGGSSLPDLIRYAEEIIYPYHPKQIIIYCGENDLADSVHVTPTIVLQRFQQLFRIIRKRYKQVPVVFVSIKPSPSRWKLEAAFLHTNRLIRTYLQKQKHTRYVNVHLAMLNKNGTVNKTLFVGDELHMNAAGYAIWQQKIRPVLLK